MSKLLKCRDLLPLLDQGAQVSAVGNVAPGNQNYCWMLRKLWSQLSIGRDERDARTEVLEHFKCVSASCLGRVEVRDVDP